MSQHLQHPLGEPSRDPILVTVARLAAAADVAALRERSRKRSPYETRDYAAFAAWADTEAGECLCVPPADDLVLKAPERALVAKGWRFVAVPRFVRRRPDSPDALRSPLNRDLRSWLAVPPEGCELAARPFDKKGPALAWAEAQAVEARP